MKLKTKIITQHFAALGELNGQNRIIETEGKPSSAAFECYRFPSQAKVNIIRNIATLKPAVEAYGEAHKALVLEISPDGTAKAIDDNPVLLKKFNARRDELLETEQSVKGLLYITWETLDAAKVPAVTISNLGKIVKGIPAANDADLIPDDEDEKKAEAPAT